MTSTGRPTSPLSRRFSTAAHVVLWLFLLSALFEGYLFIPGLPGQSLVSVLEKVVAIPLPLAAVYFWWRLKPAGQWVVGLYTAWLVWVLIAYLVHQPHNNVTQYYTETQVAGWLTLVAAWVLARHPLYIRRFWQIGLPIVWVATIAIGWWEIHTGHHLGPSSVAGRPIPTVFYFNPNDLGAALALLLPLVWFWPAAFRRADFKRWSGPAAAVLTLLLFYLLIKTGSRGGEVAVFLDLMALPLVLVGRARRWAAGGLAALVAVMAALIVWARHQGPASHLPLALSKLARLPDLVTSLAHVQTKLPPGVAPGSVTIRWALYRSGLRALKENPWGLGPRGAMRWYIYYVHHYSPFNTYGIVDAHNLWLEVAINYGWLGFVLFVAGYVLIARAARRAALGAAAPLARGLGQAVFSGLIGFVVGALSPSSVMIGFLVMWVVLGLGLAAWRLGQPGGAPAPTE